MRRRNSTPTWPFTVILGVLFILNTLTPGHWRTKTESVAPETHAADNIPNPRNPAHKVHGNAAPTILASSQREQPGKVIEALQAKQIGDPLSFVKQLTSGTHPWSTKSNSKSWQPASSADREQIDSSEIEISAYEPGPIEREAWDRELANCTCPWVLPKSIADTKPDWDNKVWNRFEQTAERKKHAALPDGLAAVSLAPQPRIERCMSPCLVDQANLLLSRECMHPARRQTVAPFTRSPDISECRLWLITRQIVDAFLTALGESWDEIAAAMGLDFPENASLDQYVPTTELEPLELQPEFPAERMQLTSNPRTNDLAELGTGSGAADSLTAETKPGENSQSSAEGGNTTEANNRSASVEPAQEPALPLNSRPLGPEPGLRDPETWIDFRLDDPLLIRIERLSQFSEAQPWITEVTKGLELLNASRLNGEAEEREAIQAVFRLLAPDSALVREVKNDAVHSEIGRTQQAIRRRLTGWQLIMKQSNEQRRLAERMIASRAPVTSATVMSRFDCEDWLSLIEEFEESSRPMDGRNLLRLRNALDGMPGESADQLAAWFDDTYRNANFRITISEQLLNQLLPAQQVREQPVRERVLGLLSRGWSRTSTELRIRLDPGPGRLACVLEAQGSIFARTKVTKWPATLANNSRSRFVGVKRLELSPRGSKSTSTMANVNANTELADIQTAFDDVPVLGAVIQSVAKSQHDESEPKATQETNAKIKKRVQSEMDAAVEPQLQQITDRINHNVLGPIGALGLTPDVVEMNTTNERCVMRLRLAQAEQLSSGTPRPQAPVGNLASVQLHESCINNLCENLHLEGRTFTLVELHNEVLQKFGIRQTELPEDVPSDLKIRFAKNDPACVRFRDGKIELTLSIDELRKGKLNWNDFRVRVSFRPEVAGLSVQAVRDEGVQLMGKSVHGAQIALRGIFTRIFSQERKIPLLGERFAKDPRMTGCQVSQFVVEDGWVGLAISGHTVARQEPSHPVRQGILGLRLLRRR